MIHLRVAVGAALILIGCGDNLRDPFAGLTRVSGDSLFPPGCGGPLQRGTNFAGLEVEPWLAVDPTDPMHLLGAWQQDRWSNGGSNGVVAATSFDGGATWQPSLAPFSRCSGGNASTGGELERATNPWVTFGTDGTAYQIALAFDSTTNRHAILASQSTDGGRSWSEPATLRADDDPDVFNDKESITADPTDPRFVYAVWDRLTGLSQPELPIGTGPTWFARATAGVWEPARPIFDPGLDAQTIGNVIVVLPDGTLVDLFVLITKSSSDAPETAVTVIRSADRGDTWSAPVEVARYHAAGVTDPDAGVAVRSGTDLAAIAVDPGTGALHAVWEDSRLGGRDVEGIALSRSLDGGATWSPPIQINAAPDRAAFTPAVAVTRDGMIGVTYYELDEAEAGFRAVVWLATSSDGGATWFEAPLTAAFELGPARIGDTYFLGDYQGLAASGGELVPFFVAASAPSDVFVRPVTAARQPR